MTALDDNDLLRAGQLPADPAVGCGPPLVDAPCSCGRGGPPHLRGAFGCKAPRLDALTPPKPRAPRDKAPDGAPWPLPRIAVDTAEQRPWAFGHVPAPWQREGERGPVHHGVVDRESLVNEMLGGPWHTDRANLGEADYQLLGPDGVPLEGVAAVERKSMGDLRGSLSAGHDRLMREMERLAGWTTPVLIVEAPVEVLLGARSGLVDVLDSMQAFLVRMGRVLVPVNEALADGCMQNAQAIADVLGSAPEDVQRPGRVSHRALLGSALSILTDHRIPVLFLPSREWAEYAAAWILRRAWRRWLADDPARLAAERERGRVAA